MKPYFKVLFIFCLISISSFAQPDKQKELEAKRIEILNEIKQINKLLFKTQSQEKSVLTQVEDLDQRINAQENLIKITNRQANFLTREINNNLKKIEQLRNELSLLKDDYAKMIVKSYKSKSQQSRVMFLLSSKDFFQAYKRVQYMKQYAKYRKEQGESIKQKTIDLQALNTNLVFQKKQKQLLVAENKVAKEKLNKEKILQEELIATLKKDENKFVSQIRKKQRAAEKIDRQIEDLIKAAIAASNKNNNASTTSNNTTASTTFKLTPEAKVLASKFTSNKGKLPWPVEEGVVVKKYGKQRHPQLPNVTTYNSGVEIATSPNTKARAVFNGVVLEIQQLKGANRAIYIQHGNYITVYNNITTILVKKGDKVTTNQELGTIYQNPTTGKTIIKFLIFKNASKMNPADWIYKM